MRWRCERLKPPRMPGKAVHVRMHGPQDAGGQDVCFQPHDHLALASHDQPPFTGHLEPAPTGKCSRRPLRHPHATPPA